MAVHNTSAPRLIVVTGAPATGKTTLGRQLATDLRLPYFYKDGFKELLCDELEGRDRSRSRLLGIASTRLLYHIADELLAAGCSLILESNFDPIYANKRLRELLDQNPCDVIQIHCTVPPDELDHRLLTRGGEGQRHRVHRDLETRDEFSPEALLARHPPLDIGGALFSIDTFEFDDTDYGKLLLAMESTNTSDLL